MRVTEYRTAKSARDGVSHLERLPDPADYPELVVKDWKGLKEPGIDREPRARLIIGQCA